MFAPLASIRAANRYRSITGAGRSALGRPIVRARSPARLGPLRRDRPHAIRARSIFFANPRTTQGRIEPWCKPCMPADRIPVVGSHIDLHKKTPRSFAAFHSARCGALGIRHARGRM
ncbi:hypothetical protein, partial [Burkholderia pseudomallei]|uniref:hypothetical protein n=2 Tax=Burkholderia pseudomallei TaxID=28450 RepID=UPI001C3D54CB